jgi:hypothetical protein
MTATTEANWAPLEARLSCDVKAIREFMWMYRDEDTGVEYYKHTATRRYLLLRCDGRCFQQAAPGLIEADFAAELRRVRGKEAN